MFENLKYSVERTPKRLKFIITAVVLVFVGAVVSFGVMHQLSTDEYNETRTQSFTATSYDSRNRPIINNADEEYISISINMTTVDLEKAKWSALLEFFPSAALSLDDEGLSQAYQYVDAKRVQTSPLSRDVILTFDDTTLTFPSGNFMQSIPFTGLIASGSGNNFPFDEYSTEQFFVSVKRNNSQGNPIPLLVSYTASLPTVLISNPSITESTNSRVVAISFLINRTVSTKIFAMFVGIILWVLSLGIFILATTLWMRHRKVEPPTIAVSAAFLFAAPVLRNSVPSVPEIGITSDVIGFFWNMAFGSIAVCLLLLNYIVKYKKEKPRSNTVKKKTTRKKSIMQRVMSKKVPMDDADELKDLTQAK